MPEELTGAAPAKVNLVLEVLGKREDGFHEVDTILQTLELADALTLVPGGRGVQVSGPYAPGTPGDESNLAYRALAALRSVQPTLPPFGLRVEKCIPPAGGLGGGASDAATALRLAQQCAPGIPDAALLQAANAVGSDEAALVLGGTVRATGRGDVVAPLAPLPPHGVVLFIPPGTIDRKTGRMFAALGEGPWDDGAVARRFAAALPQEFSAPDVYNAFERVAFDVFPGLAELQAQLESRTGDPVRLAGAGPTLFWIGPLGKAAAVARLAAGSACTVVQTATAGSLWRR